ncbi:hypothetical protein Cgig2_002974 [Carnegiea gigantea]|uniref:Uncharacterized protein n=1 Tax=Carnegiea gigantea TaxID=171969 RepID=A0A9Q1QCR8_9CARY|nr:hypothetical protein Cgig2_002974 [Carnegiea gigantea]
MTSLRLRAPERIRWIAPLLNNLSHLNNWGGAKASARGSDLRGSEPPPPKGCKLSIKPTIVSFPHDPSQFATNPRAVEPDGMRSKRSPLAPGRGSEERVPSPTRSVGRTPMGSPAPFGHFYTTSRNFLMEIKGNPMLRRPQPIKALAKFREKNKCWHTTSECRELKKALHELVNQGQLNHFLTRGGSEDRSRHDPKGKKDNDVNPNTKIITTIIGGIDDKELNAGYRQAQIRKLSQVMAAREWKPLVRSTMTFGPEDMHPLQTSHNDALVIQLNIATAIVRRILVNTISSVDIINLECLTKLHNEKDLEAAETPIVGSGDRPHTLSELKDYLSEWTTRTTDEL